MDTIRRVDLGDGWVLTESIFTGTQTGTWLGIPPTGRTYQGLKVGQIDRFNSDGLIVYSRAYYDNLSILAQLGVLGSQSSSKNWEMYK
jgi:predicted ester cyclase